jgi:hypothetical protein
MFAKTVARRFTYVATRYQRSTDPTHRTEDVECDFVGHEAGSQDHGSGDDDPDGKHSLPSPDICGSSRYEDEAALDTAMSFP